MASVRRAGAWKRWRKEDGPARSGGQPLLRRRREERRSRLLPRQLHGGVPGQRWPAPLLRRRSPHRRAVLRRGDGHQRPRDCHHLRPFQLQR